jgi:cytoskeletal protein CcmA (bactofilin family)
VRAAPRHPSALLLVALLGILGAMASRAGRAAEYRGGERVDLSGSFDDALFAAGGRLRGDFDSADDVFLAGGEVVSAGRTREALYVGAGSVELEEARARTGAIAGGDVSVAQAEFRDLLLAGGSVRLQQSAVQDDLVMAGGDLRIDGCRIGGSVTLGGGRIYLGSEVGGDSRVSGGDVVLGGRFAGDVSVSARRLTLGPRVVIEGNLTHAVHELEISPQAQIRGRTLALPPQRPHELGWGPFGLLGGILVCLGSLVVAPLLAALLPGEADRARQRIRGRFWESLGRGTLTGLLAPVLLGLLLLSFVATPIALAALPFLLAAGVLGWSFAAFAVGDQLRRWRRPRAAAQALASRAQHFGWTALACVVLGLLLCVPLLGALLWLIALLVGLGAVVSRSLELIRTSGAGPS